VLHEHIVEYDRQITALKMELYVCVASSEHDEHSLTKSFEDLGFKIKGVRFKARSKGTCSYDVEFEDAENATKALADHNQKFVGGVFVAMCVSEGCEKTA
jgi:hypothetical protein